VRDHDAPTPRKDADSRNRCERTSARGRDDGPKGRGSAGEEIAAFSPPRRSIGSAMQSQPDGQKLDLVEQVDLDLAGDPILLIS
jgi:hypothetical protein